jgi:hypothetical protein
MVNIVYPLRGINNMIDTFFFFLQYCNRSAVGGMHAMAFSTIVEPLRGKGNACDGVLYHSGTAPR